jgi:uracil-DNA glycosylase family protein
MVIGEQPGDREDLEGHPFVGPAGRLLEQAFLEIGIDRSDIYITNVIKHFKFELRGKRRLHKAANAAEVHACLAWLDDELARIRPRYIVCLGALASRTLIGPTFRLTKERGMWLRTEGQWVMATVHPSFVLRARSGQGGEAAYNAFLRDLQQLQHLPGKR